MSDVKREELLSLLEKYKKKVEEELGVKAGMTKKITSREYNQFRAEFLPRHLSLYEKLCNISEKVLKVKPDKKKESVLREAIDTCHLNITPAGVVSFSLLFPIVLVLFGSLIFFVIFKAFFFVFFFLVISISIIAPLNRLPTFFASNWRLKASNQMVLCIFYVVTYMRHTSNLENAIEFASEHLSPPLSLDLRKILWDVETGKYESVKESLEIYLETWKKWNMEFIESFHLIEASLYEGGEERRLQSLDKALDVILSETYEKMLHYAYNLKSPITMLHMLGIILPILGLVILPLIVSFMEGVRWYHLAMLYNVALPIAIYLMGKNILSKRPTGYGETDIAETPELKKYKNILFKIGNNEIKISPVWVCVLIGGFLFLIGITPLLLHFIGFPDIGFGGADESSPCNQKFCLLGYHIDKGTAKETGPFGLGASILGLAVTLSAGISTGMYFKLRSKNLIGIREKTKKLEQEFASSLFQLGNRLGDGMPVETAVGRVAEVMKGTTSGSFFQLVDMNVRRLGMGVKQAIFHPKYGALVYFPSNLIKSSMKVLVESIKKGPVVAAQALINVSRYIKEIHKVNERLKDLLSDIISSMASQIKFLTPVIAGIVVGITSMISNIISKLSALIESGAAAETGLGGISAFSFKMGIPPYYFQIIVGIYVVQVVYILTVLSNGIQNGSDKLNERHSLGKNLVRSTTLYCLVSVVIIILFNLIASQILSTTVPVG